MTAWTGTQVTESQSHPEFARGHKSVGFLGDAGGDFLTYKQYLIGKTGKVELRGSSRYQNQMTTAIYSGSLLPVTPGLALFPNFINSSFGALETKGATAISRAKPTNSTADAAVFLGELLKDGIPTLVGSSLKQWRDGTKAARKVPADEYLNVEFGYKPILNDMKKFIHGVQRASTILRQYERDSGKVVRRRYNFPPDIDTVETMIYGDGGPFLTSDSQALWQPGVVRGACVRTRTSFRRQWFSGAFTYHLPSGYDSRNAMDRAALQAKKVFGLELTPEVIWNLTPWSWAADWVTNAGDVISNLSDWATDGLVLRYGYIMEHSFVRDEYTWVGPTGLQTATARPSTLVLANEVKMRRKATPFGFGLNWSDFSPRQFAIAAALGLSKS